MNARKDALVARESQYWGKCCTQGHSGLRYARDRKCVECKAVRSRDKYRREHQLDHKLCSVCGVRFIPAHFKTQTCSYSCFRERANKNARRRRRPLPKITCLTCNNLFGPKTQNHRYCSKLCSSTSIAHRERVLREFERRKRADAALKALNELGIQI